MNVKALGVDMLSLSAHKFNGPKGAGAIWIKRGTRMLPIVTGGKHERNRRAGTENVPAIAGMGIAAQAALAKIASEAARLGAMRDRLEAGILDRVAGHRRQRRPGPPGAQHDQHQLRSGRGREPADRARSRRRGGVDRLGLFVGHSRAVTRAPGDGTCRRTAPRIHCASAWDCFRPTPRVDLVLEVLPRPRRQASRPDPPAGLPAGRRVTRAIHRNAHCRRHVRRSRLVGGRCPARRAGARGRSASRCSCTTRATGRPRSAAAAR